MRTNRNVIEVDEAAGVVRRYPITPADRADLPQIAARFVAARDRGLPAPEVLDMVLGSAPHLVMRRMPGRPLMLTTLSGDACRTFARDLVDLRDRLVSVRRWPLPAPTWAEQWALLARECPTDACHTAARTAASVVPGLFHGDLSGGNLLVDGDGHLTAVLDWDGAVLGDPALDWRALVENCPPPVVSALRRLTPDRQALDDRSGDYLATWSDQWRLWRESRHPWFASVDGMLGLGDVVPGLRVL